MSVGPISSVGSSPTGPARVAQVPFVFGDAFELSGEAEHNLSRHMGAYWRNFVHSGDPNSGPAATPTRWEAFGGNESTQVWESNCYK